MFLKESEIRSLIGPFDVASSKKPNFYTQGLEHCTEAVESSASFGHSIHLSATAVQNNFLHVNQAYNTQAKYPCRSCGAIERKWGQHPQQ